MRAGELSTPTSTSHDGDVRLCVQDIHVSVSPSVMQVRIKQSKTDLFCKGVMLGIGRTGTKLCPVTAVLDLLLQGCHLWVPYSHFWTVCIYLE